MGEVKIYEIIVDIDDERTGMLRNSFVDRPAVEYEKLNFSAQEASEMIKQIHFNKDNKEQKFMSVSMIADTPIPRKNEVTGEIFGVVFTKESVNNIVNKFVKDGNINEVSFQHTDEIIEGVYLVEHFITKEGVVECPAFKDLPEGSWVTTYWVPDTDLYNELLNDEDFNGFSIELNAKLEEMVFQDAYKAQYEEIQSILDTEYSDEEKASKIKSILGLD